MFVLCITLQYSVLLWSGKKFWYEHKKTCILPQSRLLTTGSWHFSAIPEQDVDICAHPRQSGICVAMDGGWKHYGRLQATISCTIHGGRVGRAQSPSQLLLSAGLLIPTPTWSLLCALSRTRLHSPTVQDLFSCDEGLTLTLGFWNVKATLTSAGHGQGDMFLVDPDLPALQQARPWGWSGSVWKGSQQVSILPMADEATGNPHFSQSLSKFLSSQCLRSPQGTSKVSAPVVVSAQGLTQSLAGQGGKADCCWAWRATDQQVWWKLWARTLWNVLENQHPDGPAILTNVYKFKIYFLTKRTWQLFHSHRKASEMIYVHGHISSRTKIHH